tara:strand:- start:71 stop:1486 length:1416 start_codon:yes stop_codon:yes gene_type:complete
MACVISAPSSGSGKTLLSILLASWAIDNEITLQSFKAGPDYLDSELLSNISGRNCRNLDLTLSGLDWVKNTFHGFGSLCDLTVIEGVMGLFDGIGTSSKGSTAELAKELQLPVILVIDASGQAASIAALVEGFKNKDHSINIAGVVINKINSSRHKELLEEVLVSIGIKMLGSIPNNQQLKIKTSPLGLAPSHEIRNLKDRISIWSSFAEKNLDMKILRGLMKSPSYKQNPLEILGNKIESKPNSATYKVAIAEDNAFHFRYPETKEFLEIIGIKTLPWSPLANEEIPEDINGIILPGGFPENYAEQLSVSKRSLDSLKTHHGETPIYAECGGMLILGQSLDDINNKNYKMAGILPFHATKGSLKVGYRKIRGTKSSLIVREGDKLIGHEFHRWKLERPIENTVEIEKNPNYNNKQNSSFSSPWRVGGWRIKEENEGWSNEMIHASWIHLHWPSNLELIKRWKRSISGTSK